MAKSNSLKKALKTFSAKSLSFKLKFIFLALAIIAILIFTYVATNKNNIFTLQRRAATREWESYESMVTKGRITLAKNVLEVVFHYDTTAASAITIKNITIKNGYVPTYQYPNSIYTVNLLDANKNSLYSQPFAPPINFAVDYVPPESGTKKVSQQITLKQIDFVLVLPYFQQSQTIEVKDNAGNVIAVRPLLNLKRIVNFPHFSTIRGDELLNKSSLKNETNIVATNTGNNNGLLDITFIGNKYTDLSKFHNDVATFSAELLQYAPYTTRASQVAFHYVDNTSDLKCEFTGNSLGCDPTVAIQTVDSSGAPWDRVFVIQNDSTYGGSAYFGGVAVASNEFHGPQVFVHELGHSLDFLDDEYTANIPQPTNTNCYTGTPPNPAWQGIVPTDSYFLGCDYPNWYRSSSISIMYTPSYLYKFFNSASQIYVGRTLDYYTTVIPTPTLSPTPTPVPFPTPNAKAIKVTTNVINLTIPRGKTKLAFQIWSKNLKSSTASFNKVNIANKTGISWSPRFPYTIPANGTKVNVSIRVGLYAPLGTFKDVTQILSDSAGDHIPFSVTLHIINPTPTPTP